MMRQACSLLLLAVVVSGMDPSRSLSELDIIQGLAKGSAVPVPTVQPSPAQEDFASVFKGLSEPAATLAGLSNTGASQSSLLSNPAVGSQGGLSTGDALALTSALSNPAVASGLSTGALALADGLGRSKSTGDLAAMLSNPAVAGLGKSSSTGDLASVLSNPAVAGGLSTGALAFADGLGKSKSTGDLAAMLSNPAVAGLGRSKSTGDLAAMLSNPAVAGLGKSSSTGDLAAVLSNPAVAGGLSTGASALANGLGKSKSTGDLAGMLSNPAMGSLGSLGLGMANSFLNPAGSPNGGAAGGAQDPPSIDGAGTGGQVAKLASKAASKFLGKFLGMNENREKGTEIDNDFEKERAIFEQKLEGAAMSGNTVAQAKLKVLASLKRDSNPTSLDFAKIAALEALQNSDGTINTGAYKMVHSAVDPKTGRLDATKISDMVEKGQLAASVGERMVAADVLKQMEKDQETEGRSLRGVGATSNAAVVANSPQMEETGLLSGAYSLDKNPKALQKL